MKVSQSFLLLYKTFVEILRNLKAGEIGGTTKTKE